MVVLPQWNAKWDVQVKICLWLNRCGITALRLSMPYHDRRMVPGHERADHLVGSNIGLTLQANRQAVLDVRRSLQWLASQGYGKLGLVGTSIGSAVGFITMAHEPLVRAGVFLHVSTYFADVVRTGMNTAHVWEGLRANVTAEELRRFWSPISPFPYVSRMRGSRQKMLMVSARYDPTFLPNFSAEIIREVRKTGMETEVLLLPCGHYSLELAPFQLCGGVENGLIPVSESRVMYSLSSRSSRAGERSAYFIVFSELTTCCRLAPSAENIGGIFPAAISAVLRDCR